MSLDQSPPIFPPFPYRQMLASENAVAVTSRGSQYMTSQTLSKVRYINSKDLYINSGDFDGHNGILGDSSSHWCGPLSRVSTVS